MSNPEQLLSKTDNDLANSTLNSFNITYSAFINEESDPVLLTYKPQISEKAEELNRSINFERTKAESKLAINEIRKWYRTIYHSAASGSQVTIDASYDAFNLLNGICLRYGLKWLYGKHSYVDSRCNSFLQEYKDNKTTIDGIPGMQNQFMLLETSHNSLVTARMAYAKGTDADTKQPSATIVKRKFLKFINEVVMQSLYTRAMESPEKYGALYTAVQIIIKTNNTEVRNHLAYLKRKREEQEAIDEAKAESSTSEADSSRGNRSEGTDSTAEQSSSTPEAASTSQEATPQSTSSNSSDDAKQQLQNVQNQMAEDKSKTEASNSAEQSNEEQNKKEGSSDSSTSAENCAGENI